MELDENNFMFDTNIFNHILDEGLEISEIAGKARFWVTHVQLDEIQKTSNPERREQLLQVFRTIIEKKVPDEAKLGSDSMIPTESAVYGSSVYGNAKYASEDNLYEPIRAKLDQLNKGKKNNIHDALISETAIKNKFALVTHDKDLATVTSEMDGEVISLDELLNRIRRF